MNTQLAKISLPITVIGSMAKYCSFPDAISMLPSDIKSICDVYDALPENPVAPLDSIASLNISEYFIQPNDEARDNGFYAEEVLVFRDDNAVAIKAYVDKVSVSLMITGGINTLKSALGG